MTEFRRILCAVDFSQPSERAFEYALALAARLGAEVNVVHVYQVPAYALADGLFEMPSEVVGELVSRIKEQLDQFVASKARPGINSTARLCEGIPPVKRHCPQNNAASTRRALACTPRCAAPPMSATSWNIYAVISPAPLLPTND